MFIFNFNLKYIRYIRESRCDDLYNLHIYRYNSIYKQVQIIQLTVILEIYQYTRGDIYVHTVLIINI